MYDIAVYSSSFGSGEIPVFSDDMWHTLEIMDESSLDGEVGKRLNQMIPIPVSFVLCRINSIAHQSTTNMCGSKLFNSSSLIQNYMKAMFQGV
ncbi:uncharacterized protein [Arachis hypogaea]|uniref:uncharacterized protein isoform X2 n=1 Tax=Arachis hypogaea TaxID=3818 RepID=UPI003B215D70